MFFDKTVGLNNNLQLSKPFQCPPLTLKGGFQGVQRLYGAQVIPGRQENSSQTHSHICVPDTIGGGLYIPTKRELMVPLFKASTKSKAFEYWLENF